MATIAGTTRERAEAIAAEALGFIASDEARLARFVALTGVDVAEIREHVREPMFLAGVLDYLLEDEGLLGEFVEHAGLPPEAPALARGALAECLGR